jgi:hypothetical protein
MRQKEGKSMDFCTIRMFLTEDWGLPQGREKNEVKDVLEKLKSA